ncbi:unnamed protein product [Ceutorhynchus assimilis]|uniref:DUF4371 domain-containing protein n=1 Tax=Ceutorhynchus assimilis TaxID=467358 RepID=A0A9N9MDD7_9CUCU|nr:unnamed protein product [Ceutorhynchus assimilis]
MIDEPLGEPSSHSTSSLATLDLIDDNENSVVFQSGEIDEESLGSEETSSEIHNVPSTPDPKQPGSSDRGTRGSEQSLNEVSADPALWNVACMEAKIRQILVERGPYQIKEIEFPLNKDKIFTLALFEISDWRKKGYSDWKNITRALTMHERSAKHRNAFKAWKELDIRLKQKKTIDAEYQRILDLETQHWRGVLKRIMAILVELLAEFDPVMEEHLRRVQRESDKWSVTYLSNNIQDELINLMGNKILKEIVEIAKNAKYFSIIADCTPDVSHIEQLSLTVRVVAFNSNDNKYRIEEFFIGLFFIGFFEASDSTGEGLAQLILTQLEKWSSRIDALKPLRYQLCEIYDALIEIIEDANRDAETKVKAQGLNLSDCVRMLSEAIQKLKTYRQFGYEQMKIAANDIAGDLECTIEFPIETEVRARRKKRQFDYEAVDEPLTEEKKFKVNFFNYTLDITLNSLTERFSLLETHRNNFQFLYDILKLRNIDDKVLENYCTNLQSTLSVNNDSDLSAADLQEELHDVSRILPSEIHYAK